MMNNVASYANIFNDFTRKLTMNMKPHIKEERRLKYKMEKERRLKENVSYDEGISVQN